MNRLSAIILAGGEGKRMKSDKPKTLSEVLGRPILNWVLTAVKDSGIDNICVVTGYKKEYIEEYLKTLPYPVETTFQSERLGTGHAVMTAKDFLTKNGGDVIILNGDTPFMDSKTIKNSLEQHKHSKSSATVISAKIDDPTGYGRIVRDENGGLRAIVEHKDADEETLKINEINSGGYWFNSEDLLSVLYKIKSNNKAGEYYLPDAIKLLLEKGKNAGAYTAESSDAVLGANDPQQLLELNQIAKSRLGI
ncbi:MULTISPECIES: sugar phosphate nucleotidyltransferase [unclassified Ruminococcus]|uniref:sugar phosphate nucleotidyltransferase n=1 Tax=unclassified Ruminococcus TaxID=2608920 RepID=UPI00210B3DD4|nr:MULTISPECIES: sugar phosphate nucleotidyltransferase [unclassified Ruminococcus]MCQ4021465.1 NTP transferase domain-containing protein [Ruminococcus sp. zg-924]MCQ4113910.1 NTP transferase domain-containing protein [Ruminococcus sp. zg-921]